MKSQIIAFFLFLRLLTFGQTQVKIDWPSLAHSPWPVIRGDMQGTGRSEYIGPRTFKVKWKKDIPMGVAFGPLIGYDDVLYMGAVGYNNDNFNYFYAVKKNSEDLWTFHSSDPSANCWGTVLANDSSVYFSSASGKFYALNKNGDLKWSLNTWISWFEFYLDKEGNIYLPGNDTLRVISPSGIMKKIFFPKISPSLSFSVGGDTIFAITGGPTGQLLPGSLKASDLNGNIYWSFNLEGISWGIPLVDNQNNIYFFGSDTLFSNQDYLFCIKPDGSLKWKYHTSYNDQTYSPAMDHNGNLNFLSPVIIDSNFVGAITSIDYNGKLRWIDTLTGDFSHLMAYGPVCDAEGKTYCGSNMPGGNFYCIDSNGVTLWQNIFPYDYDSCPAIGSDGTLYIGTQSDGRNDIQNLIAIKDSVTSVNDIIENEIGFQLQQNYPNPFNPNTVISYSLPSGLNVKLIVYNTLGQTIKVIENGYKNAGNYSIEFNASDIPSGVYFYRLEAGQFSQVKKMILLK
jgi:hypothetical protein